MFAVAVAWRFTMLPMVLALRVTAAGAPGCLAVEELEPTERLLAEHVARELLRLLSLHQ
jgi:hypothetical protein